MEFPNFGTQSPSSSTNLTASNRKRKAKEYVDIVPRKKIYFRGPYCRQDFAFQDSVIHSMIKNPTSTKLYEKLIHFCKYFFSKNPIVVIPHLEFKHGKHRWKAVRNCITTRIDLANVLHKLWITDTVYGRNKVTTEIPWIFNLTASLVLKIYKCDVTLDIYYKFFVDVVVKRLDDNVVPVEKLVENVLKRFKCKYYMTIFPLPSTNIFKELLKISHFSSMELFVWLGIPQSFDTEAFYKYMKENKLSIFQLLFDDSLAAEYQNRLKEIIDEIIQTKELQNKSKITKNGF